MSSRCQIPQQAFAYSLGNQFGHGPAPPSQNLPAFAEPGSMSPHGQWQGDSCSPMHCYIWPVSNNGYSFFPMVACPPQLVQPSAIPPLNSSTYSSSLEVTSRDSLGSRDSVTSRDSLISRDSLSSMSDSLDYSVSATEVPGHVWSFARHKRGCVAVQKALENADSDAERVALSLELGTHVWEATKCPNANHVIQKCISILPSANLQFIIDEIVGSGPAAVQKLAKHQYGCRVLQRLFEQCSQEQVDQLLKKLLPVAVEMSTHSYGQFVMQHIIEQGTAEQKSGVAQLLTESVSTVCGRAYGCGVLNKIFEHGSQEAGVALANEMLTNAESFVHAAGSRQGQLAAKYALEKAAEPQKAYGITVLLSQKGSLMASRYGRVLCKHLETILSERKS